MKKLNLTNVQEAGSGSENRLPAGGYVCGIVMVEDVPDKQYLRVSYDIAEGDNAHYYRDRASAHPDWGWGANLYKSYKEKALPMFKRFCSAVTKSNPGYVFDGDTNCDGRTLGGKLVGLVLGEEEYLGNDGTIRTRLYVVTEKPIEDIRNGDFKVPEKKVLKTERAPYTTTAVPVATQGFTTNTDPAEMPFW